MKNHTKSIEVLQQYVAQYPEFKNEVEFTINYLLKFGPKTNTHYKYLFKSNKKVTQIYESYLESVSFDECEFEQYSVEVLVDEIHEDLSKDELELINRYNVGDNVQLGYSTFIYEIKEKFINNYNNKISVSFMLHNISTKVPDARHDISDIWNKR